MLPIRIIGVFLRQRLSNGKARLIGLDLAPPLRTCSVTLRCYLPENGRDLAEISLQVLTFCRDVMWIAVRTIVIVILSRGGYCGVRETLTAYGCHFNLI
jgi:hypothetical protein